MKSDLKDQGQIGQYLKDCLYPRGGQSTLSLFYDEEKNSLHGWKVCTHM